MQNCKCKGVKEIKENQRKSKKIIENHKKRKRERERERNNKENIMILRGIKEID